MSIFGPANSRGVARFQSLKAVKLTGEQKDFFARQCCDEIGASFFKMAVCADLLVRGLFEGAGRRQIGMRFSHAQTVVGGLD